MFSRSKVLLIENPLLQNGYHTVLSSFKAHRGFSGSLRLSRTFKLASQTGWRRKRPWTARENWFSTDTKPQNLLKVAILGPPNAGKSTLFNRLADAAINRSYRLKTEKRKKTQKKGIAIVSPTPGTTRDRRQAVGRLGNLLFQMIDTAGVDGERLIRKDTLLQSMVHQTAIAAQQADVVLLLFDARRGLTEDVQQIASWLRRHQAKRVHVLGNKLEHWNEFSDQESKIAESLVEAARVGFGPAIPVSALQGDGMSELASVLMEVADSLQISYDGDNGSDSEKPLQLAILGRPNVGKSTLVNALLKADRVLVGPTPGLTRDSIAVEWTYEGRDVKLVDTAGIRKRRHEKDDYLRELEEMAVQDAMRAMKTADVAVLVIDAGERMLRKQELSIADAVLQEGRSIVVAANKMDLVVNNDESNYDEYYPQEEFTQAVRTQLEECFPMLRKTPVIAMSALHKDTSVDELMPVVFRARDRWAQTITTGQLNRWLTEALHLEPVPSVSGKRAKIKYVLQTKGRPPTFLLFCSTDQLPESYLRFLKRNFQDTFEMYGMDVRLVVKKSAETNPFAKERKRSGSGLGGRRARKERTVTLLKTTGSRRQSRRRQR